MELAHLQPGRDGQLLGQPVLVLQQAIEHAEHSHHQRGGIVAAALLQRRLHQRLAQGLCAVQGQVLQALGRHDVVDTVGQEDEHIAHLQVALAVVHHQAVFGTHGTQQLVAEVRVLHGVVVSELLYLARAQQVRARIAHVRQGIALPSQHQGSERRQAANRMPAAVQARQPGVLRTNDAIQGHRRVPGFGRAEVIAHQTRDRGLRSFAPHAAHAHAIGDGGNGAHGLAARLGEHGGREILVDLLLAGQRGEADVDFESHAPAQARSVPNLVRHNMSSAPPFGALAPQYEPQELA